MKSVGTKFGYLFLFSFFVVFVCLILSYFFVTSNFANADNISTETDNNTNCETIETSSYNDEMDYLNFTAHGDSYIDVSNYKGQDLHYAINDKTSWTKVSGNTVIPLSDGSTIYFKGDNPNGFNHSDYVSDVLERDCTKIKIMCDGDHKSSFVTASGEIMTIINSTELLNEIPDSYPCFGYLFKDSNALKNCPNLSPIKLSTACYAYMFNNCDKLDTEGFTLVAEYAYSQCYHYMFASCDNLITMPTIMAKRVGWNSLSNMFTSCVNLVNTTSLAGITYMNPSAYGGSFSGMFERCSKLVTAPDLPTCKCCGFAFAYMFLYCSSLINVPETLPNELDYECYHEMFAQCESLEIPPKLLQKNLYWKCYEQIFKGCHNLKYVYVDFESWDDGQEQQEWTREWLIDTNSTGYLICSDNLLEPEKRGSSTIPEGWIMIKESEMYCVGHDYISDYDGAEHSIKVDVVYPRDNYNLTYSIDDVHYSETPPKFKDICENETVYYKLIADGFEGEFKGQNVVTINKKKADVNVSGQKTITYGQLDPDLQSGYTAIFNTLEGETLTLGTDYSFVRDSGDIPSDYVVHVDVADTPLTNNYEFNEITNAKLIINQFSDYENSIIENIEDSYTYTGFPICPKPLVTYRFNSRLVDNPECNYYTVFEEGKDYSVTYENNVEVGTAKITIKGLAPYCNPESQITKTFEITRVQPVPPPPGPTPDPTPDPSSDVREYVNGTGVDVATGDSLFFDLLTLSEIVLLLGSLAVVLKRKKVNIR